MGTTSANTNKTIEKSSAKIALSNSNECTKLISKVYFFSLPPSHFNRIQIRSVLQTNLLTNEDKKKKVRKYVCI